MYGVKGNEILYHRSVRINPETLIKIQEFDSNRSRFVRQAIETEIRIRKLLKHDERRRYRNARVRSGPIKNIRLQPTLEQQILQFDTNKSRFINQAIERELRIRKRLQHLPRT